MRWQQGPRSENVEDRRGMRGPVMVGGGIGTLVLVVLVMLLGGNPMALLQQLELAGVDLERLREVIGDLGEALGIAHQRGRGDARVLARGQLAATDDGVLAPAGDEREGDEGGDEAARHGSVVRPPDVPPP